MTLIHHPDMTDVDPVLLLAKIDSLTLSTATCNVLKKEGIEFIFDLVRKYEAELCRFKKFGWRRLNETKAALANVGLRLAMFS